MKTTVTKLLAGAAALVLTSALAPAAFAGCGIGLAKQPASWTSPANPAHPMLTLASTSDAPIVGMWAVTFTSGTTMVDWGYSQWHSDGTELMNSGGHPANSGNFCMGVWERTGPNSYRVNHIALAYDPSSGALVAKIILKESVTLNIAGTAFQGIFSEDIYDPTSGKEVHRVVGDITGTRFTLNSSI